MNRDESTSGDIRTVINEFYMDSDDEDKNSSAKTSAIIKMFKPFELAKSLAMADQILENQSKQNDIDNFQQKTQGFISCTSLAEADLEKELSRATIEQNVMNALCAITESELLNCCNRAEEVFEKTTVTNNENSKFVHELSPNKNHNTELVNSILEDFSQSPLAKDQINTCLQYTPEFRLRRKPLKNYSRKFRENTKTNLNQRIAKYASKLSTEYNDDHSSCSSLSIQEDIAVGDSLNHSSLVNTDNTERLCENLLNLSEYFTQAQTNECLSNELKQQDASDLNLPINVQHNYPLPHSTLHIIQDILTLRSKYPNRETYNAYNSVDDFHGFTDDEEENEIHDLSKSDIRHSNKSTHLDNFVDDDYEIFACINTENILQQHNIKLMKKEMQNVGNSSANVEHNSVNVKESSTSNCKIDFSKSVKLSQEERVTSTNCDTKIINKDVNLFENPEDYEWNDDCDLFLNIQTPISLQTKSDHKSSDNFAMPKQPKEFPIASEIGAVGFTTAGGKNLRISKNAQKSVQKLLHEFAGDLKDDYNYENELKEIKCKLYAKSHSLELEKSTITNINKINKVAELEKTKGKNTPVSMTGSQSGILKGLAQESKVNSENNLNTLKNQMHTNFNKIKISISNINFPNDVLEESKAFNLKSPLNKNNVELQHCAEKFKDIIKEDLKTEKSNKQNIPKVKTSKTEFGMGFQTANGKSILISREAQQRVGTLLQDFDSALNVKQYENVLEEMKASVHLKKQKLKLKCTQEDNRNAFMQTPQWPLSATSKRKNSLDNMDLESSNKKPCIKIVKNISESIDERSLNSPSSRQPIILRKNLLSLTKRRKSKTNLLDVALEEIPKINKETYCSNVNAATPSKTCISLVGEDQVPVTPNLKEFLSHAPLTSTPQINHCQKLSQSISEHDLKPIIWKSNDSMSTTKLSDSLATNITLNSSNPTAKERIGRLKMYEKAPALSPIVIETHHNCRPSGLRRTRSMLKNTENK